MNERIKAIRKSFFINLSQEAFGNRIGLTKAAISKIESGVSNPSEQTILSICREFNVNEDWLRTGSGEMFNQLSEDEELAFYIGKITNGSDKFKIDFIKKICLFSEAEWDVLKKMFQK